MGVVITNTNMKTLHKRAKRETAEIQINILKLN
jgi:hypothetical protein